MNDDIILTAATKLKKQPIAGVQRELPEWAFVTAILDWQCAALNVFTEQTVNCPDFQAYLTDYCLRLHEGDNFTGDCWFSVEKLSGMTSYIAARGHDISKTKLNKLLFYSDFVNYYLHGKSISGSRYIHMPHGPVAEYYRETLDALAADNKLQTERKRGHDEFLANVSEALDVLSMFEVATIQWVLDNFDSMNAHGISEFSHGEKAFRFTRLGECIPYEFAKHFEKLPDPVPPDIDVPISGH